MIPTKASRLDVTVSTVGECRVREPAAPTSPQDIVWWAVVWETGRKKNRTPTCRRRFLMPMVVAETVGRVASRHYAGGVGEGGGRDDVRNTILFLDCTRLMQRVKSVSVFLFYCHAITVVHSVVSASISRWQIQRRQLVWKEREATFNLIDHQIQIAYNIVRPSTMYDRCHIVSGPYEMMPGIL